MFTLNDVKVPVSGTNMHTDAYVIGCAIEKYGVGASLLSRDSETARIRVFTDGENPFEHVIVYHMKKKSISFEGKISEYIKTMLCGS